jgi:hypothetical protein
LKNGWSASRHE